METTLALGLVTMNGSLTISYTLNSLVQQSFRNFKVFILDNQSSDDTYLKYLDCCGNDERFIFIHDKVKRNVVDAQRFIFNDYLINYKYCSFICDDDIYSLNYFENLLTLIESYSCISLAYGNSIYINELNNIIGEQKEKYLYNFDCSRFNNSSRFLIYRNCVP